MSKSKRKTRSDKFPLTLHPTGQYCKKINGKLYYFGSDKNHALEKYLSQASYLHGNKEQTHKKPSSEMRLKELCDFYLQYQYLKVQANALTARHHNEQIASLKKFMSFLGQSRKIDEISTLDLQSYRRKLQKEYSTAHRMNLHISIMKAMFHWAKKNDVLDSTPNIDAVSRGRIVYKQRQTFSPEDIRKLLDAADVQMRAMIWLGLNCGFGCTDCAGFKWSNLDFKIGRVKLARKKTGISRDLPLWSETIAALDKIHRKGKLVFYTSRGNSFVRTILKTDGNGNSKYSSQNSITRKFSRLIKKAGLDIPKGIGFYTLRRTAATIAARSGDPFAVQRLLGHADLQMATRYVQDVSKQTDEVIKNSRNYVV
ncbi:MAG: tyrosine-type recombinase/integrase [Planctomycetota bacterium]|jgi:integrase